MKKLLILSFIFLSFVQKPEHPEDGMIEVKRPGYYNLDSDRSEGRINYYVCNYNDRYYVGYSICVDKKCKSRRYFWYKKFVSKNMLK